MRLSNCEIRPGEVLAVCNNYGTVKAACCGMFSKEDDIDKLPPVYPFLKTSNSSFSEPQIGDLIWVLINKDNPQALFYVFQGDAVMNDDDILSTGYDDCEIISKKGNGCMFWNDTEGWDIKHGDSAVDIDEQGVHLSVGGESQPAVLGNNLLDVIQQLMSVMQDTAEVAASDPHTAPLAATIQSGLVGVRSSLNSILSKNHTLD